MNSGKIRKTIYVALFVSLAGQIHFDFFTEGFIVALSTIVMAIFIYCYEDLTAAYIACLSGFFSPVIRMIVETISGTDPAQAIFLVLPDMAYFFPYAAVYTGIYALIIRAPKSMKNFPYVIFFSDFLSNIVEVGFRSLMTGHMIYSIKVIAYLALIAFVRMFIVMIVIYAVEAYGKLLISQEREREYRELLTQASTIAGELRVMDKNAADVELVMKQAYDLYYKMKEEDISPEYVDSVLSIAKNTHEIKGDYRNVLDVLNDVFLGGLRNEKLRISEIISLERSNVLTMAKKNRYGAEIISHIWTDFYVPDTFQMMSVIRNLLTNAVEAIGQQPGRVTVTVDSTKQPDDPYGAIDGYIIKVRDNGPGIGENEIENLFMEGYSTKFDPVTGNIQRGLGLCLVKDYVENEFGGELTVASEPGKFTEFSIIIPKDKVTAYV